MEKIIGLVDTLFTPSYANGDVNLESIEAYATMLQKDGLKGVFVNGSSGEGYMPTAKGRMQLVERWMQAVPEGFKVIIYVGSCCLRESVRLAEHAEKIGAWGIGAMVPPFPKTGCIGGLVKYCETIAATAPSLSSYYYHIPVLNGAFLSMLELLEAVDGRIPSFTGIKYTFRSLYEYSQCHLYEDGKFGMLHGQDETILLSLAQGGAKGGIGGTTSYNGRGSTSTIEAWNKGDIEIAREKQDFSQEVINVICHFCGNIAGGKRTVKLIGFDFGPNRAPFQNMTDGKGAHVKKELGEIGFFERCNKF